MDKTYLGQRLGKFDPGLPPLPYTRVDLLDENGDLLHTAGDDTGKTLEAVHPDATQEMAESILASVRNFIYRPYTAQEALLDPAAEVGDGITLGGVYSLLAHSSTDYDALCLSDLEAPESDEIDEEYPFEDPLERLVRRNIQSVRSFITKTATEINLTVEDLGKQLGTTLRVGLDGVTITNAAGEAVTISGGQIDASKINTAELDASRINAQDLHLSGVLSWADFSDAGKEDLLTDTTEAAKNDITQTVVPDLDVKIQNAKDRADSAYDLAWEAEDKADAAQDTADEALEKAEETSEEFAKVKKVSGGQTYIDGSKIYTGSIYTDALHLGGTLTIYDSTTGTTIGGKLGYTQSANDGRAAMHMQKGDAQVMASANGAKLSFNGVTNQVFADASGVGVSAGGNNYRFSSQSFRPTSGHEPELGLKSAPWGQIWSTQAPAQTSDRNRKHDIEDLDARYLAFFDHLRFRRFKLDSEQADVCHPGFVAQEVESALEAAGLEEWEFAGLVKSRDLAGNETYYLQYSDFICILAAKIKQLEQRMEGGAA